MSKNLSKNMLISLDSKAIDAFNKLKSRLISQDAVLAHPNFEKEFQLTTDVSDYAIGVVLSQEKKPIIGLINEKSYRLI